MPDRVYIGDTALIEVAIYDEDNVSPLAAIEVSWKFRKPDGTILLGGPQSVQETYAIIALTDTDLAGPYDGQITFTLSDDSKRSAVESFEVVDPLESSTEATTGLDGAIDRAWMKLEDLFDSELGGPWLRDKTMAYFDKNKLARLLPDALYYINNFYQPASNYDDINFPFDQHGPLLSQALLVEGIYHLMRSYVEQYLPANSNISYFDRRDYLQRWGTVLQLEEKKLLAWLDIFKRDLMGFGSTSTLIGGYNGIPQAPRYMRGRFPWTNRLLRGGYW